MASLLALQDPRFLTAEEFLQIDFGPELRAELDDGVIRMMTGGSREHARVQANIISFLRERVRGSGCHAYGSDMAVATHDRSVRYPDVTVDCGAAGDRESDTRLTAPRVIVEVLSPSTRDHDLRVKKEEYRALPSVDTILFVDPGEEWVIVSQRVEGGWIDTVPARRDVALPSLAIVLPADETFARD
ncbi:MULTISPECIES: Uma2 family endonuclease [unclassified Sphingomonas]|uniref:Uma2 family endonuclease n=1 Tax=unclassified Sphingomonas TaxID=196159 RepID=UPI0016093D1A|nr:MULTISPECIES: Uma2 family endonuclease [unclassified Sphingomonas]MBB3347702.1 Uma2 family endonuclease [Sphingomonas sp. BK069]MBB3472499.1 Uma2 family endonuclease [Sphingomonas sp. BK345]